MRARGPIPCTTPTSTSRWKEGAHRSVRALFKQFPALSANVAHVDLGLRETPVESVEVAGTRLLVKRDDLSADPLGGNKVRALEFLLAGAERGDTVLTVGSSGSTHALATAI